MSGTGTGPESNQATRGGLVRLERVAMAATASNSTLGESVPENAMSDPDAEGSRLTLFLATAHGDAPDHEVMGTLDAIRRLVEADA